MNLARQRRALRTVEREILSHTHTHTAARPARALRHKYCTQDVIQYGVDERVFMNGEQWCELVIKTAS